MAERSFVEKTRWEKEFRKNQFFWDGTTISIAKRKGYQIFCAAINKLSGISMTQRFSNV